MWDCSDIVFALSDDLIEWSAPQPLYQPVCKGEFYREICKTAMLLDLPGCPSRQ